MNIKTRLEKDTYTAGEKAKGTLSIKADKVTKVRRFRFSVCGKERYEDGYTGGPYGMVQRWDEKFYVFFCDLSAFLSSLLIGILGSG
jgi:hypothetical protein